MKTILHEGNQYVLRFDRGEEVMEALKKFCQQESIDGGFFQGLGACDYLKLSSYDLSTKKYNDHEFNQTLEIANITGNVAIADSDVAIHMHGTFSDDDLRAIAGHVMAMRVAVTCEVHLIKFDQPMMRKLDSEIGLKLLE
jgi:uncharacterized protein